jgi:hypothetical protein
MVDASCGRVITTAGKSAAECAKALADALEELARTDGLLGRLSAGGQLRALSMRWPAVVGSLYDDVSRRLRRQAARAAGHAIGRIQARHL